MGGHFDPAAFEERTTAWCSQPWSDMWAKWDDGELPGTDKQRLRNQCYKTAWMELTLQVEASDALECAGGRTPNAPAPAI